MNNRANQPASANRTFDYNNQGWPRDFDIRIEVAEQQEVIRESARRYQLRSRAAQYRETMDKQVWHTSEYDF